jgi:hypothetical protein
MRLLFWSTSFQSQKGSPPLASRDLLLDAGRRGTDGVTAIFQVRGTSVCPFNVFHTAIDTNARTQSFVALRLLLAKMVGIFENIEPAAGNLHVYGHKVRELLLLAAMEAEASWAAILKANGYPPKDRLNTTDYVKLLDPMLLDSFSLALTSYPEFPSFAPLRDWDPKRPTQSLAWYDAYNATKHNREERLDAATLERAIHAVGATVIMFYAQFGWRSTLHGDESSSLIRSVFTDRFDTNKHPHSGYIPDEAILNSTVANTWAWKLVGTLRGRPVLADHNVQVARGEKAGAETVRLLSAIPIIRPVEANAERNSPTSFANLLGNCALLPNQLRHRRI